jgi:sporulation protein YlmC with PRC-barrel domain
MLTSINAYRLVSRQRQLTIRQPPEAIMLKTAALTLAVVLSTTLANAQTSQSPSTTATPSVQVLTNLPANAATITHWYKQNVYDPSDAKIGDVEDVLIDKDDGKVVALIVAVGGFLGAGEKDVAVPFKAVQFKTKDNNKWYAVMNATKDSLKTAPGFKYDRNATAWMAETK